MAVPTATRDSALKDIAVMPTFDTGPPVFQHAYNAPYQNRYPKLTVRRVLAIHVCDEHKEGAKLSANHIGIGRSSEPLIEHSSDSKWLKPMWRNSETLMTAMLSLRSDSQQFAAA